MGQLEAGTRIDGRYRIVGLLGAGGMGEVYRARDEKLGRQVALKTVAKDLVGSERARARLKREARAAAALEHSGIAQVYDVGEMDDGGAYLVMELVRGRSLRELMRYDAIERHEVLNLITEIATALDHAHARGVIHRDIKPDNVMLREDGRACLLDFGLAKALGPANEATVAGDTPTAEAEHLTKEGTLIGTLSYLAPEQARGRDVGPKSDQFALATMAYEALAGRLPWDGHNAAAVLAQILVDEPPAPSSLESSLPLRADRVFARALSKRPEDRFEDASAFASALLDAFDETHPDEDGQHLLDVREGAPSDDGVAPPSEGSGAASWASWGLGGGAVLAIALAVGLLFEPGEPDPDPVPAAPGLAEDAIVACPVLSASGVGEEASWLGAMAAHQACDRLTYWLGGDPARTRVPAELEGLPLVADDDFPEDPWVADHIETRTLVAAREFDGWLGGTVLRASDGSFIVELELRAPDANEPLARARGESRALYRAVADAVDAIAAADALPTRGRLDDHVAPWLGMAEPQLALAFYYDLGHGVLSGIGGVEACEGLIAHRDELGAMVGEVGRSCARLGVDGAEGLEVLALDRSSTASLALTAAAVTLPEAEARALATELAEARRAATVPLARATLAKAEITILEQLGDMDRARDLLLVAARELPRDWFLRVHLVRAMLRTEGAFAATRALAAWVPDRPEAWRTLALPLGGAGRSIPWLRRAYLSGGSLPLYGIYLAKALLRSGRREEVRPIAARYATAGPRSRVAGEYLRARIEMSEGRFGRAFERMLGVLVEHERLGLFLYGDTECVELLMQLARVLGRGPEAADPLAQRFVLAEPHRLAIDQPHYELPAITMCMHASPRVAAPCLARLRSLRETGATRAGRNATAEALLTGAERYVDQDWDGAARAWRPLVRRRNAGVFPDAFERAAELGLLDRLLARLVRQTAFAGISPAHPLAARRAVARGELDRARELAEAVIRSWGTADVDIAAVDEMRALVADLPGSGN